jgi:subtilase family serine protease
MSLTFRCSVLLCAVLCPMLSLSQTRNSIQQDRVAVRPDLRARTRLQGHVPSWVANSYDIGVVRSDVELNVTFVLSRSPEQQAQFEQLLADQQNPDSSRYHQWLTPQQVGEQYGPTQHDLDALREWLSSQGLTVKEVAPSGMFVNVSAAASSMGFALGTEFHYFQHNGVRQMSATAEPEIPSALAPIIASISGLAEVEIRPAHHIEVRSTSKDASASGINPQATFSGNHYITPGDFATIFDLKPVYSAGYTGTGQKVAVIGRSRVATSDITAFESTTGVATNLPNTVIPSNGIDPGMTNEEDRGEATLDAERVIGVAPGAQVDLVVSGSLGNSDGITIAAQYEVQRLLDPVMTISFGSCEAYSGPSGVGMWDALFSQAASEGISVFVSAGDSGAPGCDASFSLAPVTQFLSVNSICSSSYATCVGGTEFVDFSNPSQYWSSTNSTGLTSALGYIPEGTWNESTSYDSSSGGYTVAGGGGGASIYVPKPSWQTGTGVPADHARDVPDLSFPSAGHDGYFTCFEVSGNCASNYSIFYGTSAASPSMAGVAAILNQKMGGAQGNINPLLYQLAGTNPSAFHDSTPTSSGVYGCSVSTPSMCNNSTPAAATLTGGLAGYLLTTGYDQATGLGSLDVANFITAASTVAHSSTAATTLAVYGGATTITNKQTATFTATVSSNKSGTPTGTVQFYADGSALGVPVTVSSGKATTPALPFSSAGTYYITAVYTGDKNYAGSTAPGFTFVVTGLTSLTTVTASSTSLPVGTTGTFSASVTPSSGSTTPTGTVRFSVLGNIVASVPLVNGRATTPAISASTIGSYTVTAEYQGDSIYSPSNSAPLSFAVTKQSPIVQLSSTTGSIGTGGGNVYGIYVRGAAGSSGSSVAAPTGTVQMYLNGVALNAPFLLSLGNQTSSPTEMFSTPGTYSLTAVYSGDANWLPATSNVLSQTVLPQPATLQMTHTTSTITAAAGQTNASTDTVTLTNSLGFTGRVNLTCTVAYNGTNNVNDIPQCQMSQSALSFTPASSSFQSTITLSSIAPQASNLSVYSRRMLGGWSGTGAIGFCAVMFWLVPTRRTNWRGVATALILLAGLTTVSGCGGSGGSSSTSTPTTPSGTTPGSYTVTIAATTTAVGVATPPPLTISLTIN